MSNQSLAEYVTQIMAERHLSTYDVERAASKKISQTHVHRIKSGEVPSPSTPKLKALAKGLGVQEHELFAIARGLTPGTANLAHERLAAIEFAYEGMSKKKKQKAQYVIELLEREIERIKAEND